MRLCRYGLKSKKMLKRLLRIEDSRFLKQDYVASMVSPYIDKKGKVIMVIPKKEIPIEKTIFSCYICYKMKNIGG